MTDYHDPTTASTTQRVCLMIVMPESLQDRAIDWLLAQDALGIEFSVHPVAARGPLVQLSDADERVQGFARRTEFKLIAERAQLGTLLDQLQVLLNQVAWGYWVMPVEQFAAFAPARRGQA